uniref:Pept_C1 domain-containing protein n=1 Tax=Strongyloides papillosus TaxID=174720 RepID=A0A0N5BDM9_STREA
MFCRFQSTEYFVNDNKNKSQLWNDFKINFKKIYSDQNDENIHMEAFFDKILLINSHNKASIIGNESYYLNINHFTDYTQADYQKMIGKSFKVPKHIYGKNLNHNIRHVDIPNEIDWRHYGAVSDIKNQGLCGSGWIFAANAAIEAAWKGKTGSLFSFSAQAVADCTEGDSCNGGWVTKAFEYSKYYGMINETEYPYTYDEDDDCEVSDKTVIGKISRWIHLQTNDEDYLKFYVGTIGPVVVGIDASLQTFQTYSYGIYDDPSCSETLNHVVLIIGYGKDDIYGDYWIAKNSYGSTWGEGGFFKIRRGLNRCGITLAVAAPIA